MNRIFSETITIKDGILNPSSEEDIKTTQEKLPFKLPQSYIDFIRKFGRGLLCQLFLIRTPSDLLNFSEFDKKNILDGFALDAWDISKLTKEKAEKLFVFGSSENGDTLCWDLENENNGEFSIWFLGDEDKIVGKVADNLYDFVNNFCINQGIDKYYPVGQNLKWNLPTTFIPLM